MNSQLLVYISFKDFRTQNRGWGAIRIGTNIVVKGTNGVLNQESGKKRILLKMRWATRCRGRIKEGEKEKLLQSKSHDN